MFAKSSTIMNFYCNSVDKPNINSYSVITVDRVRNEASTKQNSFLQWHKMGVAVPDTTLYYVRYRKVNQTTTVSILNWVWPFIACYCIGFTRFLQWNLEGY